MVNSYESALARMYELGHELALTPSHKFDLAYMRVLLKALGHPERRFPSVLIAGTNGKGSTAATLAAIAHASSLRTGLYTSPHLLRINERIRIDEEEIGDETFALLHDLIDRTAEGLIENGELPWHPSFFEMLTAMALEYFSTSKVDIAILEVGMGGRLDATNVVEPCLSIMTDISLDHQKFLGDTITRIAREKAGIIRRGGVVVTLPQSPAANDVIGQAILEQDATAVSAAPYVPPVSVKSEPYFGKRHRLLTAEVAVSGAGKAEKVADRILARYPLLVMGREILVESSLVGRHQLRNIALAIAAAEELQKQGFPVTAESIEQGIRATRWPGRFQIIPVTDNQPEFVFDVAHNPAGAWALRSTLSTFYEGRRIILVFGAMRDKAIGEISEILFSLADLVIATSADNPRSATPEEIREAAVRTQADMELINDVKCAVERAKSLASSDENARSTRATLTTKSAQRVNDAVVVITGSIYVVGEAMRALGVDVNAK